MSVIFLLAGYLLAGIVALKISRKLYKVYPYGRSDTGRFWWSKHLPLLGFSILLISAGESLILAALGYLIIFAGLFFVPSPESSGVKEVS